MPKKAEERRAEEETETVTLGVVRVLLQQQKEFFLDLLQQHERIYKSVMDTVIESTNKRFDAAVKAMAKDHKEMKDSLEFTQNELDKLKKRLPSLEKQVQAADVDFLEMKGTLRAELLRAESLEGHSKRNNLIFEGIEESSYETWADSERKVKELLHEKLELGGDIEFERVHRLARREDANTGQPRGIIAKFLRYKDRSAVLSNAKKLQGTKIYINEDFTEAVRKKRKDLLPALKEARKRGDTAFLRYDKLVTYPGRQRQR